VNEPSGIPSDFLAELEEAFLAAGATPERWAALERARARADSLGRRGTGAAGRQLAVIVFLAESLAASVLEKPLGAGEFRRLMNKGAEVSGLSVDTIETAAYLLLVRDPNLAQLPPQVSLDTQLTLLCLFSRAAEASVWQTQRTGGVDCIAATGEGAPSAGARAEARRTIGDGAGGSEGPTGFLGVKVTQWPKPDAVLVVSADVGNRERTLALAAETASVFSVILERDYLVRRGAGHEQTLVALTEKRFARLGFDLHDGPMQEVAGLAAEIRHFRKQLPRLLDTPEPVKLAAGRLEDIEARVVALDRDLRELARSFESPAVLKQPFAEAVRTEVDTLTSSMKVETRLHLEGDFHRLTDSQRIALSRIVQEALANVREHSRATVVSVNIVARNGNVELEIVDNGRGFDVEARLIRAARRGHLGVVGMNERVRLLGGAFTLHSQRGGPTKISVSLPAWRPIAVDDTETPQVDRADELP
jgi:signal transduction histidine kinase